MKTGALLRFACQAGGILAAATPAQRAALVRYGAAVGQAFQIADDLLDLEGDPALVGKSTGKDAAAGKATLVSILGAPAAKARLRELVTEAETGPRAVRTGGRGPRGSGKIRRRPPCLIQKHDNCVTVDRVLGGQLRRPGWALEV